MQEWYPVAVHVTNRIELRLQYTTKNAYFHVCCRENRKGIQSILVFDFSLQNFLAVVSRKITWNWKSLKTYMVHM